MPAHLVVTLINLFHSSYFPEGTEEAILICKLTLEKVNELETFLSLLFELNNAFGAIEGGVGILRGQLTR